MSENFKSTEKQADPANEAARNEAWGYVPEDDHVFKNANEFVDSDKDYTIDDFTGDPSEMYGNESLKSMTEIAKQAELVGDKSTSMEVQTAILDRLHKRYQKLVEDGKMTEEAATEAVLNQVENISDTISGNMKDVHNSQINTKSTLKPESERSYPAQVSEPSEYFANKVNIADDESLLINIPAETKSPEVKNETESFALGDAAMEAAENGDSIPRLFDPEMNRTEAAQVANQETSTRSPEAPSRENIEDLSSAATEAAEKAEAQNATASTEPIVAEQKSSEDSEQEAYAKERAARVNEILNSEPIQGQDEIDRFDRVAGNPEPEAAAAETTQSQPKKRSRLMRILRAPIYDAEKIAATNAKKSERASRKREELKKRDEEFAQKGQKPTLLNKAKFFLGFPIKEAPRHVNGSTYGEQPVTTDNVESPADTRPTEVINKEDDLVDSNR